MDRDDLEGFLGCSVTLEKTKGTLFGAWTIRSGAATKKTGKKGATEQLRFVWIAASPKVTR